MDDAQQIHTIFQTYIIVHLILNIIHPVLPTFLSFKPNDRHKIIAMTKLIEIYPLGSLISCLSSLGADCLTNVKDKKCYM